ncbi:hypothetical protein M231_05946 [Tremella mesenterica]|uniref:SH3 domain-containing protein n=1 Tax=Tremella mesenterica TaxID=5217 RepID=A0A4Q1BGS6_TREME|nr:hypothetical protein M231_05946 [Tremella mesenterica]
MSFPYLARTTIRYKSPHETDLSFEKDVIIRVTGPNPDDEDWLVGETMDGVKSGGFPKDFVIPEPTSTEDDPSPTSSHVSASRLEAINQEGNEEPSLDPPAPPSPVLKSIPLPPSSVSSPVIPPSTITDKPETSSLPATENSPPRQTLKERLAFFNAAAQAQSKAAPPPIKPKPVSGGLTWSQRQALRKEQEAKEQLSTKSEEPAQSRVTPAEHPPRPTSEHQEKDEGSGSGMSANDATSSVIKGMSLKERMAALQGAGAFGTPEVTPSPPASTGKVWKRPPPPPEPQGEEEEEGKAQTLDEEDGLAEAEEPSEEEQERARRAAIAARMAKLGTRGPMAMALPPPKPIKKPTLRASPSVSPSQEKTEALASQAAIVPSGPVQSVQDSQGNPAPSIPPPQVPQRIPTLPQDDLSEEAKNARSDPPPQVMVEDEEKPLSKSDEQLAWEKEAGELGRQTGGAEGGMAAGIALAPIQSDDAEAEKDAPTDLDNFNNRGVGVVAEMQGPGSITDANPVENQEVEEGMEEGGQEKDDIMKEAQKGDLTLDEKPRMVPLHPPAQETPINEEEEGEEDTPPPPPPPRMSLIDVPKDEVELKHEHDAEAAPRVSRRSMDRSMHPAPPQAPLPSPPVGNPLIPPREDEEEDEDDGEDIGLVREEVEEEEEVPPPPPARKPSLPPVRTALFPVPVVPQSPVRPFVQEESAPSPQSPIQSTQSPSADDEGKSRASAMAARMAKMGGIKFGVPPPIRQKTVVDDQKMTSGGSPSVNVPESPIDPSPPVGKEGEEEETPEQEATRKRATLARLKAGGTLGFGMFSHAPVSPTSPSAEFEDTRGLQQESEMTNTPPPIPPNRPHMSLEPVIADENVSDDAPPVPTRPPVPTPSKPSLPPPPPPQNEEDSPTSPLPIPTKEHRRSMSSSSTQASRRFSGQAPILTIPEDTFQPLSLEPESSFDDPPPVPPHRPTSNPSESRKSGSFVYPSSPMSPVRTHSRVESDTLGMGHHAQTRHGSQGGQGAQGSSPVQTRGSMSVNRPGYAELQEASKTFGGRLAGAARGLFEQGRRGNYGDGSPAGFVLLAMERAGLAPPLQQWGLVIYEQEVSSVLRRYDEPRPGDIAAFYDAKLKGKKGLQSYSQAVGSVEEPLVGVVIEFDEKRHNKIRVWQVERGLPEEVSYRCDDLKSGRIVVSDFICSFWRIRLSKSCYVLGRSLTGLKG